MLLSSSPAHPVALAAIALVSGTLASGCAFTEIALHPPPASAMNVGPTVGGGIGRGREVVLAGPLADVRLDPSRCGMKKNGYNMDTADIHCAVPPPQWLTQALADGLHSAGFVVTAAPSSPAPAAYINGQVVQFFVEPKVGFFSFNPEADIAVTLTVSTSNGVVADRRFYWKAVHGAALGTDDVFQAATDEATLEAVRGMVVAIAALLDRYPAAVAANAPLAMGGALR